MFDGIRSRGAISRFDRVELNGRTYETWTSRKAAAPVDAPRLVVVAYQPTKIAQGILRACVRAIQQFTPEPFELWVIDNNSPTDNAHWLLDEPDLNVILNQTEPLPPRHGTRLAMYLDHALGRRAQSRWGSYANAVALELAARAIDHQSRYLLSLHMDSMPCRSTWLSFLVSKLRQGFAAAGVRMDRQRTKEGVLHVLGCLLDFQIFRQLNLDFLPKLPQFDVGDLVTIRLREHGFNVYACRNTLWNPELVELLPSSSPFRELNVDRAMDDHGNVIFLHLGRGIRKSTGEYGKGVSPEAWVQFADEVLLA